MTDTREISALIQLLDDEDREVFKHVHDKIISLGPSVIPVLEQAWGTELNSVAHERLESIIHKMQFDLLDQEWENWLFGEPPDLLTGAYLVAKYHYPDLQLEEVQKKMVKLKQSIWLEINDNQTPLEKIQIFNQVFYNYHQFTGTQTITNYQDFCINHVLENKKGNAIIIGIIYQVLAQEFNLPIYGVNLVRHYILAFCKRNVTDFYSEQNLEKDILFYLNPVNQGAFFSRVEIKDYLDKMKAETSPKNFIPASNVNIIKELLRYHIEILEAEHRDERVAELTRLLRLL